MATQLCKFTKPGGGPAVGMIERITVRALDMNKNPQFSCLADVLFSNDPAATAKSLIDDSASLMAFEDLEILPPIDQQEVWAAGVTYKRSEEARKRESEGAAHFYNLVYSADRPELFLKTPPNRVVGHGGTVRVRADSKWSVPEPEMTLVLTTELKLVGFTVGNDMSARDIEGENPLYLPQAKVYDGCCALGPCITLAESREDMTDAKIELTIERGGETVFNGSTSTAQMARTYHELIGWLGRDNTFSNGAFLMTGTGIVPPDEFTLKSGDTVHIEIAGIGKLTNNVLQGP